MVLRVGRCISGWRILVIVVVVVHGVALVARVLSLAVTWGSQPSGTGDGLHAALATAAGIQAGDGKKDGKGDEQDDAEQDPAAPGRPSGAVAVAIGVVGAVGAVVVAGKESVGGLGL